MIFSSMPSRRLASAGTSPTRRSKTRSSRPPSGAAEHGSPRTRRKTSTCPSALSPASCDRTSGRLSPTPLSVPIPLVLSGFRRRGLTGRRLRRAKACPVVRGARRDQTGEPRVDHRFGAQEVQAAEYGYAAQDREPEQPALAVLQVRERVAQHGDRDQYLSGDEKLRFVRAERAQAEECADQGEFRKADRTGGSGDHGAETADIFQMDLHLLSIVSYPREHPASERTAQRNEKRRGSEIPDQDDCARIMIVKNRQGRRSHGGHGEAARNRDRRRREQRCVAQHDEHGERERHPGQDEQREAPGLVAEGKTARLKAHPVGQTPIAYGRYPHEDRRER